MKTSYKHILIIALAIILVYSNIFRNEFVWDDKLFILEREEIRSLKNIPSFFTKDVEGVYRPLRTVFYSFSYALWKFNPIGYHINSILIHIIVSALVYLITLRISKKSKLSFLTALLFALHPIHTEAITFITTNFDLFGIILYLLAFLYYLKAEENNKFYYISVLFFLLGIFSYELVISFPFIIVLYEFLYKNLNKNNFWIRLKYYLPYFLIIILFLFIRFRLIGVFARVEDYQIGYLDKLLTMPKVIIKYTQFLFVPINLTVDHDIGIASLPEMIIFLIILLSILGLAFILRKRYRLVSFSIFWFLITLLPVLNLIPIQRMMAEAYLYLPSIGFCILLAWLIRRLPKLRFRNAKIGYFLVLIIVLGSYSVIAIKRNNDWKDELTLWNKTIKTSPKSSRAHSNLALELDKRDLYNKAIEEYKISIELNPNRAKTYFNLGVAYSKIGLIDEAVEAYINSLKLDPNDAETYNNLGILYAEQNSSEQAILAFEKALTLTPEFVQAYINLGNVYNELKDYEYAIDAYLNALSLDPNIAELYYNLGIVYYNKGMIEQSGKAFDKAYELNPYLK